MDGDGKISRDELQKVLTFNFVQEVMLRDTDVDQLISEVDTNNDRFIDFDEFMKMMRGTQVKKLEEATGGEKGQNRFLFYRRYEQAAV